MSTTLSRKIYFFFSFSAAVNAETREEVAIKKIGNAFDNRIDAKRTLREIKLLRHMDHENVILITSVLLNQAYIFFGLFSSVVIFVVRKAASSTACSIIIFISISLKL